MRLQLIGPMTNMGPDFNYPAFHAAATMLREQGHEIFNPAESGGGDTTLPRAYYMRASIGGLLAAEGVVLLKDWESSAGAKTELRVALALGLPVMSLDSKGPPAWAMREEPDD